MTGAMRACPLLLLALAACSGSGSGTVSPVLATTTIGPEGGELAIDSGPQAGLRLTVPPGALAAPTRLSVRDVSADPPPGTYATSFAPVPGRPFVLEPAGLRLEERATLRMPYRVANVVSTAPGNVRVRELRGGNAVEYEPDVVDVDTGFVEMPIRFLSQYCVVVGPRVTNIASYWTVPGLVPLEDDMSFEVGPADPASPFASPQGVRWRIRGTGFDESLYFDGELLLGRESAIDNWRERWAQGVHVWTRADVASPTGTIVQSTVVEPILGTTGATPGQITVFGSWAWAAPRTVAGTSLRDVLQMRLSLAWSRADLGVGQREYLFWFAPNRGLLAIAQDGVVRSRTML
jgi:hypothetical protein